MSKKIEPATMKRPKWIKPELVKMGTLSIVKGLANGINQGIQRS